jgi:hypothetical protein
VPGPPSPTTTPRLGLYFFDIFTPERCRDMWGFGVHPILLNLLKYSSPKILYYDEVLFTSRVFEGMRGIILYPGISPIGCLLVQVLQG